MECIAHEGNEECVQIKRKSEGRYRGTWRVILKLIFNKCVWMWTGFNCQDSVAHLCENGNESQFYKKVSCINMVRLRLYTAGTKRPVDT